MLVSVSAPGQGDEAGAGPCRPLARPGGVPGAAHADANGGRQEPTQPPGAGRERRPAEPLVYADGPVRPARAQTQRRLHRSRGERHLGAAAHRRGNTGERVVGLEVGGESVGRQKRYKIRCFYLSCIMEVAASCTKVRSL